MKIPKKPELQQIAFNHSSDTDFQDFINLYKNLLQNHILFLVADAILSSDNSLSLRNNLLGRLQRLIMTIYDGKREMKNYNMILTEKQRKYQHYDKYEYLTDE